MFSVRQKQQLHEFCILLQVEHLTTNSVDLRFRSSSLRKAAVPVAQTFLSRGNEGSERTAAFLRLEFSGE